MAQIGFFKNLKNEIFQRDVIMTGSATLILLTLVASFISASLAAALGAISALGYFGVIEYQRRSKWEKRMQTDIRYMQRDIEELARETKRNKGEVSTMKRDIAQAAGNLQKNNKQARTSYEALKDLSEDLSMVANKPSARHSSALSQVQSHHSRLGSLRRHKIANDPSNSGYSNTVKDRVVQQTIRQAIENKSITAFSQPIMSLHKREVRYQEIFSRIHFRGEAYMEASRYINVARNKGYMADIDKATLLHALAGIKHALQTKGSAPLCFINIHSSTLKRGRFMSGLLRALSEHRKVAPYLVFEMRQADFETLDAQSYDLLKGISNLGCRLSLDHVTDLELAIPMMMSLNVGFVKLNAKMLADMMKNPDERGEVIELRAALKEHNIEPILEKLERESDLRALKNLDFKYGQGYLFSRPTLQKRAA